MEKNTCKKMLTREKRDATIENVLSQKGKKTDKKEHIKILLKKYKKT